MTRPRLDPPPIAPPQTEAMLLRNKQYRIAGWLYVEQLIAPPLVAALSWKVQRVMRGRAVPPISIAPPSPEKLFMNAHSSIVQCPTCIAPPEKAALLCSKVHRDTKMPDKDTPMAPPVDAWLSRNVEPVINALPSQRKPPPPKSATLPLNVQPTSCRSPAPPSNAPPKPATLSWNVQFSTVASP